MSSLRHRPKAMVDGVPEVKLRYTFNSFFFVSMAVGLV